MVSRYLRLCPQCQTEKWILSSGVFCSYACSGAAKKKSEFPKRRLRLCPQCKTEKYILLGSVLCSKDCKYAASKRSKSHKRSVQRKNAKKWNAAKGNAAYYRKFQTEKKECAQCGLEKTILKKAKFCSRECFQEHRRIARSHLRAEIDERKRQLRKINQQKHQEQLMALPIEERRKRTRRLSTCPQCKTEQYISYTGTFCSVACRGVSRLVYKTPEQRLAAHRKMKSIEYQIGIVLRQTAELEYKWVKDQRTSYETH